MVFESRMRTMISTASLPFASIECSTVVSEIRFILAIGILSKPQTEKSFGTLYFNSYNASRIPNATISLYPTKAVESVPSSRICFVRLYPEEYSSIFGDSRLYSPGERERILTQSSPITFWSGTLNISDRCWYVSDLAVSKGDQMFCDESGRFGAADMDRVKSDLVIFIPDIDDWNLFWHIINFWKKRSWIQINDSSSIQIIFHKIQIILFGARVSQCWCNKGKISIIMCSFCDRMNQSCIIMVR